MGGIEKKKVREILDAYVDKGGNFVDTALIYQDGESVEWLGEWLKEKGNRDKLVIAAKYSMPLEKGDINSGGNHRKSLHLAMSKTLAALQTDYIVCSFPFFSFLFTLPCGLTASLCAFQTQYPAQDILYVHIWDFVTPVEEMMRALDDMVRAGKVLYLGVSDTPAWVVAQANTLARERGWTPFVAFQGKYNPSEREAEADLLPMCSALGLGYIPWGLQPWCERLTDAIAAATTAAATSGQQQQQGVSDPWLAKVVRTVTQVAAQQGCTPAQAVFAWALHKPAVVSVLLTCNSVEALDQCVGALSVRLTRKQSTAIDHAAGFALGYPYKFIGYSYKTSIWFKKAGTIAQPGDPLY